MRREALATVPSPDSRHDFLVELRGEPLPGSRLLIRMVPDRLILEASGFAAYLAHPFDGLSSPEALAVAILDDLNNELVPRWVEVTVERDDPLPHRVVIEDRQPTWDNPALLARLHRP